MNKTIILDKILDQKAIAVLRIEEAKIYKVVEAIIKGGISIIEITATVPNYLNIIEKLADKYSGEILLGVGTVMSKEAADDAITAGAQFVVSPVQKNEIIKICHYNEIPAIPGAFTPTEIVSACESGADIVKVFPAEAVGPNYFKSVLAPLPKLKLMPTGGVTLNNVTEWLSAGACAVGIGSALTDKKAIVNDDYDTITKNAAMINGQIAEFKKSKGS